MAYQYGQITSSMLPPGVSSLAIKHWTEKFYGSLVKSGDSPNNYQQYHLIKLQCDTANVGNCIPPLGTGDGLGYILSDYDSDTQKGQLATVTLTYSAQSAYAPNATATEQSTTRQVPITQWAGFTDGTLGGGTGDMPLNGAIFNGNSSTSSFATWGPDSPYIGNDQLEVGSINFTYMEYSTSEFSSDADLLGTIQTPTGAPTLADGGNWLLVGSNRSKQSYFYSKADTYIGSVPGWNTTIYAS